MNLRYDNRSYNELKNEMHEMSLKFKKLLPSSASNTVNRRYNSKRIMIAPGIYSDDIKYLGFINELYKQYLQECPTSKILDNGLFGGVPYANDHSKLLTLPGTIRTPLIATSYNNNATIDEHYKRALNECKTLIKVNKDSGSRGRINRESNSGFPFFTTDHEFSIKHFKLIVKHLDEICVSIDKERFYELYEKFRIGFCATTQIRLQQDVFIDNLPKDRSGYDIISSVMNIKLRNKTKPEDLVTVHGFKMAKCRTRLVHSMCKPLVNIITAVVEPYRAGFERRFELTFKHRTKKEIKEKLAKRKYWVPLDVKAFDQLVPYDYVTNIIDIFPLSNIAKKIMDLTITCPLFSQDYDGKGTSILTDNPFAPKYGKLWIGLRSGNAMTSILGKLANSIHVYVCLKKKGFLKSSLEQFYDWQDDIVIMNMGDDMMLGTNNPLVEQAISKGVLTNDVLQVEIEQGARFLGNLFYLSDNEINICNSSTSYLLWWIPERSYSDKFRKYPMFGRVTSREAEIYGSHPEFDKIMFLERSVFKKYFNEDLGVFERKNLIYPDIKDYNILTQADIEVFLDPSKVHYKYQDNEILEEVKNLYTEPISDDDYQKCREYLEV